MCFSQSQGSEKKNEVSCANILLDNKAIHKWRHEFLVWWGSAVGTGKSVWELHSKLLLDKFLCI